MSSTVAPFRPCKASSANLLLLIVLPEPSLAGFSVLFVVEACSPQHGLTQASVARMNDLSAEAFSEGGSEIRVYLARGPACRHSASQDARNRAFGSMRAT